MKRVLSQSDFDRFAALSRDDNPIHCDPAFARGTHFGATVAHGMFLYGLVCAALSRRIGAPWMALAQTLMFPAPTFAGDAVETRLAERPVAIGAAAPPAAPGAIPERALPVRVFDVRAEVVRDGQAIGTAVGEALAALHPDAVRDPRLAPLMRANEAARVDGRPASGEEGPATGDARAPALHGIAPGMSATAQRCFAEADLDEYADLCGDANPLVRAGAAARAFGLAGRMVPGPLLSGMFSDLLGTRLPGRGTGWMKQSLRFLRVVHAGETLQARVEVVCVRPDKQLVNLRSTVRDASGHLVVDGDSLVLVRDLAGGPPHVPPPSAG